jgi:hypothetical protein
MRMISVLVAVSLALLSSATLAQQGTGTLDGSVGPAAGPPPATLPPTAGPAPEVGGPLISRSETGLNKVADDGVSTKTVRAARCSAAAHETDGTTTCVGIPDRSAKSGRR